MTVNSFCEWENILFMSRYIYTHACIFTHSHIYNKTKNILTLSLGYWLTQILGQAKR